MNDHSAARAEVQFESTAPYPGPPTIIEDYLAANPEYLDPEEPRRERERRIAVFVAKFPEYFSAEGIEYLDLGNRKLKCLCPFHDDHDPSAEIEQMNDGKWVWFCQPCSIGGTVIKFHMGRTGLSVDEAIDDLARILNLRDLRDDSRAPVRSLARPRKRISERPERWPELSGKHIQLWERGVARIMHDDACQFIAEWRGWNPADVRSLAKAQLIAMPWFDLWPSIQPQSVVAFPVRHPKVALQSNYVFWESALVQFHIRFARSAQRLSGEPLDWIYAPTKKELGVDDGANAPLVIARDGDDPEQPARALSCDCVIITAGEWDALTLLIASGWLGEQGELLLPVGLAIVGIRGEGRAGTNAYLRFYNHWRPKTVIMLADRDKTGLAWFESKKGEACFGEQLEQRGARVICNAPVERPGIKDVSDLYRAGLLGPREISEMLTATGFHHEGGKR